MCRFASIFEIVMALELCQDFRSIPKWMKQNLTYALILMRCVGIVSVKFLQCSILKTELCLRSIS